MNVSHDFSESRSRSCGPVTKLQGANKQIQEISRYVCGQAEELATDEQSIYHLIHQFAHSMGLVQGVCDACERDNDLSATINITDLEPDEETMPDRTFPVI